MSPTTKLRCLIVDDDPAIRELLRVILSAEGYEIVTAPSAEEAYALVQRQTPDLAVVDVILPEMDGFGLSRLLRKYASTRTMPILMLTARGDINDKIAGFEAGADDYLTKPFQPTELVYRIKGLLARKGTGAPLALSAPKRGQVIAVFGARGGIGKTTLAVNLAVALHQQTQARVLLWDANFYFGSVGVHLNLPAVRTILDLLPRINELEPDDIESVLTAHSSGIRVLLSPFHPEEADNISADHVRRLLAFLVGMYDLIVVDCQASYDDRTLVALEQANEIVLVTMPELGVVLNSGHFLELAAKLDIAPEKIHVVLNRSNSNVGIEPAAIERALHRPIEFRLISVGRPLAHSVNRGVPLMIEQPRHPFSQEIVKMAEVLSKQTAAHA
ncbi:MAG: response regulator [Chloroflexi bacterium]|nr:response regulator [Chloroflexota bacterium]